MRFVALLCTLRDPSAPGSTSEVCDYVAAIWVECPLYELPVDYRLWGLPHLLQDAIKQFEKNLALNLAVSFPSDLSSMNGLVEFGTWRPIANLDELDVLNSGDVYGPT